jgi:hypothetical protein
VGWRDVENMNRQGNEGLPTRRGCFRMMIHSFLNMVIRKEKKGSIDIDEYPFDIPS